MTCLEFGSDTGPRARIWIDEIPSEARVSSETQLTHHIFSSGVAHPVRSKMAIEVFQPLGASFHYGLLGGEYKASDASKFEVAIPKDTPSSARLFTKSIARSLDRVLVGGMAEYASAIYDGIEQLRIGARPRGVLELTCMAHGDIGSAPVIFTSLARALILGLCRRTRPASLDEAMALLKA